jgi:hypothetical protein
MSHPNRGRFVSFPSPPSEPTQDSAVIGRAAPAFGTVGGPGMSRLPDDSDSAVVIVTRTLASIRVPPSFEFRSDG